MLNFASNQSPLPSSTNTGTTGTNSNILASFESNNVSNLKNSGFNGVKPNLTSPNGTSPVKIGLITLGALAPIGLAQAVSRKQR